MNRYLPDTRGLSPTDTMIEDLRAAERVMSALDQHACPSGTPLQRLFAFQYAGVVKLRDSELREWNAVAAADPECGWKPLHRCARAARVYHVEQDGPCEVYTPNADGEAHICHTCRKEPQHAA